MPNDGIFERLRRSVQARDAHATRAALRELHNSLASVTDIHEAAVLLAELGLHEPAYELNRCLVNGHATAENFPSALVNLGNAELALGRFEAALATFARARELTPGQRTPTAANIAFNAAVACAELNRIAEARASYEEALAIWDEIGGTDADRGHAVRGLAACLARTGRSDEALTLFAEALRLFEAAAEPNQVDLTHVGIMQARQRRGDRFNEAMLSELLATAQRLAPVHRASLLHNVGNIQLNQGDPDTAVATYDDLLRWADEIGDETTAAKATASLAVAERIRGHLDAAIRLNREAFDRYTKLGSTSGAAHAEHNYALLLDELADRPDQPSEVLRQEAADHAIAALTGLDRYRHSLPSATDRYRLFLDVYGPTIPATLRICMNSGRQADVAAVVERARIQPVLRRAGGGFLEPSPVAACRGPAPIGGSGKPVVLGELAESLLGKDAMWLGWWTGEHRLVRAWSTATAADADQGPLNLEALARYSAALPIVDQPDLEAASGDPRLAARIATWRAASGPMLADPGTAARAAGAIGEQARAAVLADDGVREAFEWSAEQVLWPLSEMLLSPEVRGRVLAAHAARRRIGVVVAPIPAFGRIPWAALPLTDPQTSAPLLLAEAADIAVGLPVSLAGRFGGGVIGEADGTIVIADPLGDLESARGLASPGAQVLGVTSLDPATRHHLRQSLARRPRLLAVAGHVRPGTAIDPASAAILLDGEGGKADPVTAAELADLAIPPWCLVLGCDGSGGTVGGEWTGVLTGLAWAGAHEIATSTVPVIDDAVTAELDRELLRYVETDGPLRGLLAWQRALAARGTTPPYRWATYIATRSVASE
ncbi:tetratricopeptide repeat protein [Micromonospora sp. NPDC005215]|uniref:tetratricopeptide repeat protein n=1 Tax=Micromonospora sp. NPDC005215 TaxID=3157024 RepID=UPI0033A30870